ncbi:MAG: phosphotransferase family protein [Dehalococcoidia bacterium]
MVFQDTYSQPDAPDLVLDDELVLSLVRRHAPEARTVTAVDESGGEARAYAVDEHLILKTQRPHRLRPRTSLAKEVRFLRNLASDERISAPRVLGYGKEQVKDGIVEYICMTRIPGVAARHTTLEGPARAAMLRQLGRTLRRIHEVPQVPLAESGLFPTDRSRSDLADRLSGSFARVVAAIQTTPADWPLEHSPEELAATALRALPEPETMVALHSNPGPEHVFVNPATGTFSGVIDFGDAYISHPALDLRQWRTQEDRTAVLNGYTTDGRVSDAFLTTWRIGLLVGEVMAIALGRGDHRRTGQNLRELLAEL